MPLAEYLLTLETLLSLALPPMICVLALRRLVLSRSFNRLIYGMTALFSAGTTFGLLYPQGLPGIVQSAAPLYACACLALWLSVTTLGPTTSGVQLED